MADDLTRRRLFGLAGATAAGAAGLGLVGCSKGGGPLGSGTPTLATPVADSSTGGPPWVTRPDLTPPQISLRRFHLGGDSQYILLNAPYSGPGHGGAIILSPGGEFVYFGPNTAAHHHMNVSVQAYQGEPVLTWWQGTVVEGFGIGELAIADSTYTVKHLIKAHDGYTADFHEFNVTPQGTALIDVYAKHANVDLRSVGGPSNGWLVSGMFQEIDIKTGALLHKWDSWGHVPLDETHQAFGVGDGGHGTKASPYNYFHINSICEVEPGNPDSDLLISGRNTWCVYRVSRKTGNIVDRIGGKRSSFTMGPRAAFHWQHHVRLHGSTSTRAGNLLTVFDNGVPNEPQSRAIILDIDFKTKHVSLKKQFIHPGAVYQSGAMGSADLLPDGRMFVGWGTEPHFSEFSPEGHLLLDGNIEKGSPSYRGFSQNWTGRPTGKPAVVARTRSGGATIYVSWNGTTEVASWTVLAGKSSSHLSAVGSAKKRGFETVISASHRGPWFAVEGRDGKGHVIGRSKTVKIS